jgi:hypothetical protein
LPVITAGVDLAAVPERTALASIEWAEPGARVWVMTGRAVPGSWRTVAELPLAAR